MTECRQKIVLEDGTKSTCLRPCEFRYPKQVRDLCPARFENTYKFCSAHRRLRRVHGKDSELCCRPIVEEKEPCLHRGVFRGETCSICKEEVK